MPKWFELSACDETFLETAPFVRRFSVPLPVSAETAWAELTRDNTLSWCTFIAGSRFLTPRPFGAGTRRELSMRPSAVKATEEYFRWEEVPGLRYRNTFYVSGFTVPGIRRFAEDTLVEPRASGSRLTWTFAIEPGPALRVPLRLGAPAVTAGLRRVVAESETHLGRIASG
ncbi:SRPBCC family protein [Rhodococcus sp. W8901]|uniref:SRPBCC family protein n=1 Tax=Rhodococcus sp. W8901 TaxID=2742603 RepID=UPI001583803A|nr:SRPBCC family protein [Rhodococcus sp. W8901]QKT12930.1 SRPBCC family protein [Rhodococcus sp. W8901]